MGPLRILRLAVLFILTCTLPLHAQTAVPEHRYLLSRDADFYGSDLTNLFDTTQEACAQACSAQSACVAYTFNSLKGACFPKSGITDLQPFVGAISARKIATDAGVLAALPQRRAALSFLSDRDFAAAAGFVALTAQRFSFDATTVEDLERITDLAKDQNVIARAVAAGDRADMWVRYSEVLQRGALNASRGSDRRRLSGQAISAAINGFLRTDDAALQANALSIMAGALESNRRGRDMIPALRLAQRLAPREDIATALDTAIGKYGFRVTDHKADNNAAAPRICVVFSEKLVQAGVDYEPFVATQTGGLVVQPQDGQLCLDGVAHGQRYDLTIRAGLPAASGEVLHKDVPLRIYVRDRAPSVRFSGRAYVLPRSAQAALPIETVNVDQVDLKLRRVSDRNLVRTIRDSYFGKPLSKYQDDQFARDLAQEVWTGEGAVQNTLNTDMTTRLPLAEALGDQPAGVYALSASVPGQDARDFPAATQWFVLSDLGISTWSGVDGMSVNLRSLGDASAREGVALTLISRANAVLGRATTDAQGFAQFPAGLTRGTGASQAALLLAEDGTSDVAFLPLTDPAFDLSDRGVEGHPPSPPIDAFLTTDRGAYRVGETIYATALLRDAQVRALPDVPLTAILKRPDGVEHSRQLSQTPQAGGHVFALPLGTSVPRGAWRVDVMADVNAAPLASQTVLVEDFLPERIDFTMRLPDTPLRLGATPPLQVQVDYLFGAPGSDLPIEGDLRLRAAKGLEGWDGYRFGRYDQVFRTRNIPINGGQTDAEGAATLPLELPRIAEAASQPLEAQVVLRVAEGSGRPVERLMTRALTPQQPMIGIKPLFDDVLSQGAEARFDLIAVDANLQATPMPARWTLNRVETRYQWYQLYGNWEWEPTTRRTRVGSGEVMLGATPLTIAAPTEWGRYELVVESTGGVYAASAVDFSSGWYGGDGATDTPDRLALSLNATTFDVGDMAELRVVAEGDGVAMVSVLSNHVIDRKVVPVTAGENLITLPVTDGWGSGAYVTASVLRGMDVGAGQNPSRSLGLVHAAVRADAKQLDVSFDIADGVDGQAGTLRAAVQVDGITSGETAYVTLAAVDVGILNLTGFEAPDVKDHYFGQRRLGVEMRDVYGRLIDGLNGALGTVRSGGDAAVSAQVQSPPPTEKLMAFFAGPIAVGPDGRAEVEILKPSFNGTVKLMAVAWTASAVGNAAMDVIARDPVVVAASLPRFMAPADQSRLLLEFTHAQGPAGQMALELTADSGVQMAGVPTSVTLAERGAQRLSIPLKAQAIGDHLITVVLTTPDGKELRKTLLLPVRDNDPVVATTRQFALGAGETFTFDGEVLAGLRRGTASATLTAGPLARFDVPGLLRQLDRYPYGCTEQVTSGAMPLLYLSAMAQAAGLGAPEDIDAKIGQAIEQVLTRQASNGAFGLWRARSGEFWLDAYVTDFLARARSLGHDVPDLAFSIAMDNLRNRVNYAPDFDNGGEDLAYALLVLAREGAAAMGDLRYFADTKRDAFGTPLAAAQLGAALAAYGDQIRADQMFGRAAVLLLQNRNDTGWRDDFGTSLRDTAAVLKLSAEAGSAVIEPATLVSRIGNRGTRLSTQEAAQVLMASHALAQPGAVSGLRVDGQDVAGPLVKRLSDGALTASTIENTGSLPMDVTLTAYGVPEVAPDASGYGYAIERNYFTMEGALVAGPVASGTRMVVVVTVNPFEEVGARLIIDDPLPAGFEIDNPNLLQGGQVGAPDWLDAVVAQNAEFRSDRFIAAVNHSGSDPFSVAYVVRAVTPGTYHHPAALVEDMYRAEYRATTATSRVTVTP